MAGRIFRVQIGFCLLVLFGSLAACTSTEEIFAPDATVTGTITQTRLASGAFSELLSSASSPQETQNAPPTPALGLQQTANILLATTKEPAERIILTGILGAPFDKSAVVKDRLRAQAPTRHLVFVAPDAPAAITMRGFFSAARRGDAVEITYVWDIDGPTPTLQTRLRGVQTLALENPHRDSKDPWSLVTSEMMQSAADDTVEALILWMSSSEQ